MKIRKFLIILLSLILVVSCALLMCGCDEKEPDNKSVKAPTKEEFNEALLYNEIDNVTAKIELKTENLYGSANVSINVKVDGKKCYANVVLEAGGRREANVAYISEENGVLYEYTYDASNETWYYEKTDGYDIMEDETTASAMEALKQLYDELKWDKTTATFTGENITKTIDGVATIFEDVKITFEDNKVTYAKIVMFKKDDPFQTKVTEEIWYTDYGTTSVVLPDAVSKEQVVEEIGPWGEAMLLIGKMNEKGWFGKNWAVLAHEDAMEMFKNNEALFMIEGSWSRSIAKNDSNGEDVSNERMMIPMPNVSANWIYEGSPAGRGDAVVGGANYGWMITRKAWNDQTKKAAALAFIHTMTDKGLIDNAWAGKESINPAGNISEEDWQKASLASYSMMKMATIQKMVAPIDARLNANAITALRTGAVNVGSTEKSKAYSVLQTVIDASKQYSTPYLKYVPDIKGSKRVSEIPSDITATLNVTTLCYSGDWQAAPYNAAIEGGVVWDYDNTANCLKTKYPNINIVRTDLKVDNATKNYIDTTWKNPANMPDVIYWFSDVQAAVIRDDEHLVSIAEIQKEYGDYAAHMNSKHYDKYALPVIGVYEGLYVNVKMLAGFEGFESIKTLYDSYQADLTNPTKKYALYVAVRENLSTWKGLEMACDAALANDKIPFAQDKSTENQYLIDQAVMMMGGTENFVVVPGTSN